MEMIQTKQLECPSCHIVYWITKAHYDRLTESKETFYCPNGHPSNFIGKTDAQKLKEEKKKSQNYWDIYAESSQKNLELRKKIASYKGQITKLKKKKVK